MTDGFEKYGVVADDEKTKTAGTQVCESCGKAFETGDWERDLTVLQPRCPHCGSTKNFEKRS